MLHPASVVYHVGGGTLPKEVIIENLFEFPEQPDHACKKSSLVTSIVEDSFPDCTGCVFLPGKDLLQGMEAILLPFSRRMYSFVKWMLFDQKKSVFPV